MSRPPLETVPDHANVVVWHTYDEDGRGTEHMQNIDRWCCGACGMECRAWRNEPPIGRVPPRPDLWVLGQPTRAALPGKPGCPRCGAAAEAP